MINNAIEYNERFFSDIFTYAEYPQRKKNGTILVLSLDENFKNKAVKLHPSTLLVGFKENSIEDIKDFAAYFKFFMKVLPEANMILIDGNFYSPAFSVIQSSALNLENIKEIRIYDDSGEDFRFSAKDSNFPSHISAKEKTYSRREFLNC